MAITTLDGAIAGMRPPESIYKTGTAPEAAGQHHSHFYAAGRPGAATAPSPGVNGAGLTTYAGQIPWTNPGAGNSYLARFAMAGSTVGSLLLCDRLWHNSGLSVTSTSPQGITPATVPSRDRDGTNNGVDVLAGLEVSTVTGAGTPVCTLTYTDSDGNTGVTTTFTGLTASNVGTFYIWPLAAGDVGVRTVTSYQQNVTWTSGAVHIVLFRILAMLDLTAANVNAAVDVVTGGFVRCYDDSVPFLVSVPSATTATNYSGQLIITQG